MREDDQRELPEARELVCLETKDFVSEVVIEPDPEEEAA